MITQFRLALRSLLINKVRSALTMLGVAIGVSAVILLVSFGSGLSATIEKQFENVGPNLLYVMPGELNLTRDPSAVVNRLENNQADKIQKNAQGVEGSVPFAQGIVSVSSSGKTIKGTTLVGATSDLPKWVQYYKLNSGAFFTKGQEISGKNVAVIGSKLVDEFFPGSSPIGKSIRVGGSKYTVIGILEPRGSLFGQDQDNTILAPITTVQRQLGLSHPSNLFVKVKNGEDIKLVAENVRQVLEKDMKKDEFSVVTQEETLKTFNGILGAVSAALAGIAGISLIVGGIGISNIMLVSVTERTREIGLRKAVGAKPSDILKQFLVESIFLSVLGGTVGIIVGVGASLLINQFFTTVITWWSIALAFGFSVLVGVVFGVLPAIRASRLSPIEALRYE